MCIRCEDSTVDRTGRTQTRTQRAVSYADTTSDVGHSALCPTLCPTLTVYPCVLHISLSHQRLSACADAKNALTRARVCAGARERVSA